MWSKTQLRKRGLYGSRLFKRLANLAPANTTTIVIDSLSTHITNMHTLYDDSSAEAPLFLPQLGDDISTGGVLLSLRDTIAGGGVPMHISEAGPEVQQAVIADVNVLFGRIGDDALRAYRAGAVPAIRIDTENNDVDQT